MAPFAVEITVTGRIGQGLASHFPGLVPEVVPRHVVLLLGPDCGADMVTLLRRLERSGPELERVAGVKVIGTRDG